MCKKRALVVEDTAANRIFFERLLSQAQFTITAASNGPEALEKAQSLSSIELAVLDMEMPGMNGLELTARLRKLYPELCIVVATMHDEHSLMHSAFKRGCDVFLVKPHGFMTLFKHLSDDGHRKLHADRPQVIDQFGIRTFRSALT